MTCTCGGKTIPTKTVAAKKAAPVKVPPVKVPPRKDSNGSLPKKPSAASRRATKVATKKALGKANPYAKGCDCG